jgi:hypothetical protein
VENIILSLQSVIALGILNVWLVRPKLSTAYRAGNARNMEEEFHVYGLSRRFMLFVGATKLLLAVLLIIGIWLPVVTPFAATIMAILMFGAVMMHVKVHDSFKKTSPALLMLLMNLLVVGYFV